MCESLYWCCHYYFLYWNNDCYSLTDKFKKCKRSWKCTEGLNAAERANHSSRGQRGPDVYISVEVLRHKSPAGAEQICLLTVAVCCVPVQVCVSWSPRCASGRRWTVQVWASNSCRDQMWQRQNLTVLYKSSLNVLQVELMDFTKVQMNEWDIWTRSVGHYICVCSVCETNTTHTAPKCCCTGVTHCIVVCLQVRLSHQTSLAVAVPQLQRQDE